MGKIFLDTNVLLDVFLKRDPFYLSAQKIWSEALYGSIEAGVSVLSLQNIFFILNKLTTKKNTYQALAQISQTFHLIEVTEAMVRQAVAMKWSDFEDAIQYLCAQEWGAEALITRDAKGFAASSLPILSSHQFCSSLKI